MSAGERDREDDAREAAAWLSAVYDDDLMAEVFRRGLEVPPSAAALDKVRAAERERVLAPVRALAEELDHDSNDPPAEYAEGAYADSAARLRAVLPPADTEDGQR